MVEELSEEELNRRVTVKQMQEYNSTVSINSQRQLKKINSKVTSSKYNSSAKTQSINSHVSSETVEHRNGNFGPRYESVPDRFKVPSETDPNPNKFMRAYY